MSQLKESTLAVRIAQMTLAMFLVAGASVGMVGCEQDGGAENIGESIDEGMEEAKDEVDDHS